MLGVLAVVAAGCAHEVPAAAPNFVYNPAAPSRPPDRPELTLADDDRILVLAPHPDDEVLATGGLVQQAIAKGLPVEVVFLTNGDNNEFAFLFFSKAFTLDAHSAVYAGQTRAFEAMRAGRELGLKGGDETFLGYPDFGTLEIWQNRWGDSEAFRSMFSEQNQVPYWFARTPDAPYKGESILKDLSEVVADFKPTKVFVTHPADTNPDHVAYDLFLRTVLWDLEDQVKPEVYNYLTHYGEWPKPRGLHFDAPHEPPAQFDEAGRWVTLPLEPEQVKQKLEALKRHKTQFAASKVYLESYMRANELFDRIKDIPLAPGAEDVLLLPSGTGVAAGSALPEGAVTDGATRRVRVWKAMRWSSRWRSTRPQLRPWKPISRRSVIDPISLLARCPRSASPRRVRATMFPTSGRICRPTRCRCRASRDRSRCASRWPCWVILNGSSSPRRPKAGPRRWIRCPGSRWTCARRSSV